MNKIIRNKNGKYRLYIPIILTLFMSKIFTGVFFIMYGQLDKLKVISNLNDSAKSSLIQLVSYIVFFFICYLWLENKGQSFNEVAKVNKDIKGLNKVLNTISLILISYVVVIIMNAILMYLLTVFVKIDIPEGFKNVTNTEKTLSYNEQMVWLVKYVTPVIVAPIAEELMFRGLPLKLFQTEGLYNIRSIAYIVTTSIAFGFAHYNSSLVGIEFMFAVLSPTVMGILSAVLYLKTKDIRVTMALHFLNNFLVTVYIPLLKG